MVVRYFRYLRLVVPVYSRDGVPKCLPDDTQSVARSRTTMSSLNLGLG